MDAIKYTEYRNILLCMGIGVFISLSGYAESWTNTAGHAVSAELVSRKGDVLTFRQQNGSKFTMSYRALSAACQASVDKKFPLVKLNHDEVVKQRQEKRLKQLEKQQGQ